MLTYADCLELCELSEDTIEAIAEHEHLPEMAALGLGHHLIHTPDGIRVIESMLRDDLVQARNLGDLAHVARLELTLEHFVAAHPEPRPRG